MITPNNYGREENKLKKCELYTHKYKNSNGITLIALVVTIIVLLILARNKYRNSNRSKWNNIKRKKSKFLYRNGFTRRRKGHRKNDRSAIELYGI